MTRPVPLWHGASPHLLGILRIVAAFLCLLHGFKKLSGFPGGGPLSINEFDHR